MPWNTNWPLGTASVRANRTTGNQNTTYIKTTMGGDAVGTNAATTRDHFWDVSGTIDGYHRHVKMPKFTVGGVLADPIIAGSDADGIIYYREVNADVGRVEGFYRNTQGIYQFIPSFLSSTHAVTNSFTDMVAVPINVYGEIFMCLDAGTAGQYSAACGFFKSNATKVDAWALAQNTTLGGTGGDDTKFALIFANDATSNNLNIKVRRGQFGSDATWKYRITYRAL